MTNPNPIEQALTTEEGFLDAMKMIDAMPGEDFEKKDILPHIGRLLAQTKLSDEFISRHFKLMPFDLLLEYNRVPEEVMVREFDHMIEEIIDETVHGEDADVFMSFLNADYSQALNERVIAAILQYLHIRPEQATEEAVSIVTSIINARLDNVSRDFILGHIGDIGYLATNAMLNHPEITLEDTINVVDSISIEELTAVLWDFAEVNIKFELNNPDDKVHTVENKRRVLDLLKVKTERMIQEM